MNRLIFTLFIALGLIAGEANAQENWETLNKNSMTAYNAKDYDNAFKLTMQALAAAEKEYGTESQRYGLSSHNMGYMHMLRKEYAEAAKHLLKAVTIRAALKLDADQALSAREYGNIMRLHLNDITNAEKYLLLAKDLNKKVYTEKSKQYYATASDLAQLYFNTGQYAKAEPYYLYMLQATKEQSGVISEGYAVQLKEILTLYSKFNNKTKYFAIYEELLTTVAALGYDNNDSYYGGMFTLADYYEQEKNAPKTISTYRTMMAAVKKNLGDTSKMYLMPLIKVLTIYNSQADYKNMSFLSEEMVSILDRRPVEKEIYY
ncbi:MAG: tetratricopeptide repeat protein, partial [Sphingobacteriales bacterium]